MSSASFVPETRHRADDGARETARALGFRALLAGAGQRLTATTGMGQLQRSLDRLYGTERPLWGGADREVHHAYAANRS